MTYIRNVKATRVYSFADLKKKIAAVSFWLISLSLFVLYLIKQSVVLANLSLCKKQQLNLCMLVPLQHVLLYFSNVLSLSRNLNVTWELTITDMSGCESTLELSWSHFSETSVTLCWCGGNFLPDYKQISSLELHGVRRIALCRSGLKK